MSMVESLLDEFELQIEGIKLIPSFGGVFEVTVGDQLIYSKKETGRHVEGDEVLVAARELFD